MRRLMLGAVTLACATGLAAPAIAGDDDQFEGLIERDDNTYLGLNILKKNGKKFIVDGLGVSPYTCIGGDQGYVPFGTGKRIRINDRGRFKASQQGPTFGGPIDLKISGKVNGRVIRGSVGWRLTEETPDPSDDCYTGQLAYRVSRDDEFPGPFRTP
jgi:hypothetical protein